uniref:Uncharacterized protein n=1 Tax=Geospiza parvula TaxID=87175 RepID=A0A8C3MYY8_GEOPR
MHCSSVPEEQTWSGSHPGSPVPHGRGTAVSLIPAPCPPQEQAVALSLMFSSFLLPTAWVLSNIYNYRSRPE